MVFQGFPGGTSGKEPACQCRRHETGSIPGSRRSPGEGNVNPLQYSCLENSIDRGAWQATVHGVAKSQTQLKQLSTHASTKTVYLNRSKLFSLFYIWKNWGKETVCFINRITSSTANKIIKIFRLSNTKRSWNKNKQLFYLWITNSCPKSSCIA